MTREERIELIDKLEQLRFFNQRAGRELWGDKPREIQDKDIENADEILSKAISALSENKLGWIPVTERTPKNDTEVVYCTEMGTVGSCHYYEGFNHYKGCSRKDIFDDIVAWLPIPEPYKGE